MGSQVLSEEEIEREACRVAAAFEVGAFTRHPYDATITDFFSELQGKKIWWTLDARRKNSTLRLLDIKKEDESCQVSLLDVLGESDEEEKWGLWSHGAFHHLMARGLYRLGFEDEGVLAELNYPLTTHEKLELRLSMPREFWPKAWLEGEAQCA